jgi:uracil-DNA glycosylase family 4
VTVTAADTDPGEELAALAAALRAHLELCGASGATGLPAASRELADGRAATHVDVPAVNEPREAPRVVAPNPAVAAPPKPLPEGASHLQVLATEVAACTRCRLHETRKQTVFSRGTGTSGLCFIGEGPGADEDEQGEPFVGKAGQLLDRMIEAMGFSRDEVYVCNIVKCRPPKNRKPEPDEMTACTPFLTEQIELIQPKVIVAMGATAMQGLLGLGGIMRLRGTWKLYKGVIPVMPTFHPAYLLRTPEAKREVWQDLQEVLRQMGRTVPARK